MNSDQGDKENEINDESKKSDSVTDLKTTNQGRLDEIKTVYESLLKIKQRSNSCNKYYNNDPPSFKRAITNTETKRKVEPLKELPLQQLKNS